MSERVDWRGLWRRTVRCVLPFLAVMPVDPSQFNVAEKVQKVPFLALIESAVGYVTRVLSV